MDLELLMVLSRRFSAQMFTLTGGSNFGYDFVTKGVAALQYVAGVGNTTDSNNAGTCALTWSDPTSDMLGNARELAFRAAIHAANETDIQTILAISGNSRTVYTSKYLYLGLVLFFTLFALLCIVPAFSNIWILARLVSLSPIEVAKAFDASLLRNSDANLLKEVGGRNVRYGVVSTNDGRKRLVMSE